jgi:L-threonylcarbamoyladenylate synthase
MNTPVPESVLAEAVAVLRGGGIVAMPTETVYGLGADAANPAALKQVFALKGRPADHPLIVHVGDADQVARWAREVPDVVGDLVARFWPGPLTIVLRKQPDVPDLVTGGQDTVAVRMPNHPVALTLLRAFGGGIAAPSANRFGRISPTTADHVREEFGPHCPLVLDGGPSDVGLESTILSLADETPCILRPGGISADDLAKILGAPPRSGGDATPKPRVPGSTEAHYAPLTALVALSRDTVWDTAAARARQGDRVAVISLGAPPPGVDARVAVTALSDVPAEYGHRFYATLRDLDREGFACIYVEAPPEKTPWIAVRDRLRRAVHGSGESS